MTILKSIAQPGAVQAIIDQGQPIGLALGLQNNQGVVVIYEVFPVHDGNYGKILDVMARLTMMGAYKAGMMEVKITTEKLPCARQWFEYTNHGKMKAFLSVLQEKQKNGVMGLIAVTMSASDDIPRQFKLTHLAMPEYDKF